MTLLNEVTSSFLLFTQELYCSQTDDVAALQYANLSLEANMRLKIHLIQHGRAPPTLLYKQTYCTAP